MIIPITHNIHNIVYSILLLFTNFNNTVKYKIKLNEFAVGDTFPKTSK